MTLCVASGILISRVAPPELRISRPLDDPFWDRAHIGLAWHHFEPGTFGGQGGTGPHRVVRGQPAAAVHRGAKVTPGVELNTPGTSGYRPSSSATCSSP